MCPLFENIFKQIVAARTQSHQTLLISVCSVFPDDNLEAVIVRGLQCCEFLLHSILESVTHIVLPYCLLVHQFLVGSATHFGISKFALAAHIA